MSTTAQLPAGSLAGYVIKIWAQALFCSPLRRSGRIGVETVCRVAAEELARHMSVPGGVAGSVAKRAGDYPELFTERMAWCLEQAAHAYAACCDECRTYDRR
jgi:hypothetical protein